VGIHVVNDKKKYQEWEFVYDIKNDKTTGVGQMLQQQQNLMQGTPGGGPFGTQQNGPGGATQSPTQGPNQPPPQAPTQPPSQPNQ
jgi:hypothetical protein